MLQWSQDRRRGHEQRLRHGASYHEGRHRQVAESYNNRFYEREDTDRSPGTSSKRHPKRGVVSDLASFHEEEYVNFLKVRRDMRASQPHDRGKWKCMGTEFVDGAEHASSLHIAAHPDAKFAIERQFWAWCGREVTLEKLVVDSPAPPSFDGISLDDDMHPVNMSPDPTELPPSLSKDAASGEKPPAFPPNSIPEETSPGKPTISAPSSQPLDPPATTPAAET
ncbi:hypothetical protein H310_10380 [Aphanomyces invadans]|uniref:Uncharacterized protein n=1 Tax=Aphanomyces invadans TaxID=157072 RepID=A0A024TRD0_9STRA|nr:hypothetical protein H310_10380 [Aphanomyces invadans]ETV96186.1 hypothetical protein H310_10380 [Aphanomyces invadans]|eukprot:XP_008874978.1 hypothetical protein H310_10380 [Aphanomyces invadans]